MKAYHEETMSEFSVTMMSDSSSGWAKKTAPYWMELEPTELAERAAQKALASREPREVEPGRYTVILEPSAMLDLLGFMIFDFSGLAVHEQRSCLDRPRGPEGVRREHQPSRRCLPSFADRRSF